MINVNLLSKSFTKVLIRFPWVILIALVGCIASSIWLDAHYDDRNKEIYLKIILSCIIILPLQISYHLLNEKHSLSGIYKYFVPIFLFPLVYGLMERVDTENGFFKFSAAFFTTHLFLAFILFPKETQKKLFWETNQIFFTRFAIAILYSTVLYAGISIAILAVDVLLNIKINGRLFEYLFFWSFGFLNTVIFLSGIPPLNDKFQTKSWENYPLVLKILVQYILLPLVSLYLVILYLYIIRILTEWSIPKGWVSYLVLCFSIAGILSLLLIEPLREHPEQKWINTYFRYFYRALVPLLILLFVAIGIRIWEYGFTVPRYYVFLLAIWLAFITFYFLLSHQQNIQIIPKSLFFAGLASFIPPFSANFVSEYSQMSRLTQILENAEALKNGKIQKNVWKNKLKEKNAASNIATYLLNNHSYALFHPWLEDSVVERLKKQDNFSVYGGVTEDYLNALGLNYYGRYNFPLTEGQNIRFYGSRNQPHEVDSKSLVFHNLYFYKNEQDIFTSYKCKISKIREHQYAIHYKNTIIDTFSLESIKEFALKKIKDSNINQTYDVSLEFNTTEKEVLYWKVSPKTKMYLFGLEVFYYSSNDSLAFQNLQADLIVDLK